MSVIVNSLLPSDRHSEQGLSSDLRVSLFRSALRIRRVEEAIARHYSEQEMRCPTHLCIGQEAVPVGVSAHLLPRDYVFSGHRSHGHYLAKGGRLTTMLAELYGRATGCALGRGGSQHLIDLDAGFIASAPILAGTLPIGVGLAFASAAKGEDRVTVVYFGDGATEEGVFHEALNFAAVRKAPVIFVCENNLYSVHSAMDVRQPAGRSVADIGQGHSIPGRTADGNDLDAVWDLAGEAVARARRGEGPSLLEFMTYRWAEHCGPNEDLDLEYRSREEFSAWQGLCPIAKALERLTAEGLVDTESVERMEAEIAEEIREAVVFAKSSPFPDPAEFGHFTYPGA